MEKLKPLNVMRLHHAEAGQIVVRFFEDFEKSGLSAATDADFKKMFDALKKQLPAYNESLNQIRSSEESKKIEEADALRDEDLQAFKNSLKPYRTTRNAGEQAAYAALDLLMAEYKGLADMNYEEETNRLATLLQRLQADPYMAHTDLLGITRFVTQLAGSAKAFSDLFAHRSFQNSQKVHYDIKAMKKTLTGAYRKMAGYIETMAGVKDDAFYKDVLSILNNGRTYFASTILARRQAPKEDKKDTPPSE